MIERQVIVLNPQSEFKKKPTVSTWKTIPIILNQSPLSAMKEVANHAKEMDYVKIGIIGNPHTGKTTLSMFIAHMLHRMMKEEFNITYQVKIFTKKELLNFEETIMNLLPANYILIFDDVSFSRGDITPQQLEKVKQAETTIRHFPDKKDVKIIQIDNYHYSKGHDKYLRQSDYKCYTSVGSEEKDNVIAATGPQYVNMIMNFQRMQNSKFKSGYFSYPLGNKHKPFAYKYRQPFIPVLFWNGSSLRNIITPERAFVDQACAICATAENKTDENFDLDKYHELMEKRYRGAYKTALKVILQTLGINTWGTTSSRAMYDIMRVMNEKNFDIWSLGEKAGLKIKKPHYSYQVEKMLKESDKTKAISIEDANSNNIGEIIQSKAINAMPEGTHSSNNKDEEYTVPEMRTDGI